MARRWIWYDDGTGRLRSGWRALVFLSIAALMWLFLRDLLRAPFELAGVDLGKAPLLALALEAMARIPAFLIVGVWALRAFERLPANALGLSMVGRWGMTLLIGYALGIGLISVPEKPGARAQTERESLGQRRAGQARQRLSE